MGTILFSVGLQKLIMFWKGELNSWVLFQQKLTFVNGEELIILNVWNNNDILINRKPVIYKELL